MDPREELAALRRLAELEAKVGGGRSERIRAQQEADRKLYDPTAGQSFGENLKQGIGQGMASAMRALGGGRIAEAMGLPATKEEAEQLDAPLLATSGGTFGNVVGMAAPAALAIPFTPATIGGAAVAGAITGGALTEGGLGDRATGAALGGAGGAVAGALPAVARTVKGVYRGLTEPLTDAGRQRIAGRAIERFSTNPQALASLSNAPTSTGARLTLPEATRDTGLATLQRAISTMDPEAAAMFAARSDANNAARVSVIQNIAGDPAKRAAAEAARKSATDPIYAISDQSVVPLDNTFSSLMARPAFQKAVQDAQALAKNEGLSDLFFRGAKGEPVAISGQGAHYIKKALDDLGQRGSSSYMGDAAAASASKTQGTFLSWLDQTVPEYAAAKQAFAEASKPINAMDVGQRLLDKTTANMRDLGGNQRLQANSFARALNDEETLLRQATGFRGNNALADVMDPSQLAALQSVRNELETVANLGQAANGPGSQTAKMLASQNMLRQIAGPLGLPESWIESVLSQTALRPIQFGYKAAEPRIGAAVAEGLLDPARAQQLLNAARQFDAQPPPNALQMLLRRSAPALVGSNAAQ